MSTLISLFLGFSGLFLFSFILWKRLHEDYPSDDIFTFTLGLVLSALVSFWLSSKVIPSLSFWFTLLGSALTGVVLMRRYSFRFFEVIDALVPAFFWLGFFLWLASKNYLSAVFLISFAAYKFLEKRYRQFSWYPSGKIGFAGLASLALFFLLYTLLAILPFRMLSLSQDLPGSLVSGTLALVLALVLFFRSGNEKAEKALALIKNGKEKKN